MSNRRWTLAQRVAAGMSPDVTLVKIEHQDGDILVWDGAGILEFNGEEWQGIGRLGSVSIAAADTEVQVADVVFTLSGVDPEVLDLLDTKVKGNTAWVWKAFLREDYSVQERVLLSESECDQIVFTIEPNGLAQIKLLAIGGFFFLEAQSSAKWDAEEQRNYLISLSLDPDSDTGFDLMASMKQRKIAWLPS
jgi:hypothetical protein